MDLYYVRQDRAYFILDLLITNSGLIGEECINLTNVIEQSTEVFNETDVETDLSLQELQNCFNAQSTRNFNFNGERADTKLVIDTSNGNSYEVQNNTSLVPRSFRTTVDTIRFLLSSSRNDNIRPPHEVITVIKQILLSSSTGPIATSQRVEDTVSTTEISIELPFDVISIGRRFISANAYTIRYRTGDHKFVVFNNGRLETNNGEVITLDFEQGVRSIIASGFGASRSETFQGIQDLLSRLTFNNLNSCQTLLNNRAELESTQTPAQSTSIPIDSINISSLDSIINNTKTSITDNIDRPVVAPGTFDNPELRDRLDREANSDAVSIEQAIEQGDLNNTIISGINDYLNLISTADDIQAISNNSVLTTDLINNIKLNNTYRTDETAKVNSIEIITAHTSSTGGSGLADGNGGNADTIHIRLRSRVNDAQDFIVRSGNNINAYPGATFAIFDIQLGLYTSGRSITNNNDISQRYRIRSITINTPNYISPNTQVLEVPTANIDLQPGDNNTPQKP